MPVLLRGSLCVTAQEMFESLEIQLHELMTPWRFFSILFCLKKSSARNIFFWGVASPSQQLLGI